MRPRPGAALERAPKRSPRNRPSLDSSTHDIEIESVAPGGNGVGRIREGGEMRAVFVRGASPGDRVRTQLESKGRPLRARVLQVLEPGPGRRPSPCEDAERCGGCDWIHLDESTQSVYHESILRQCLPAALREHPILHAPPESALQYRSRARLHIRVKGGRPAIGFYSAQSRDLVSPKLCHVLSPELEFARSQLGELFEGSSGEGELDLSLSHNGPVLFLRWKGEIAPKFFTTAERWTRSGALQGIRIVFEGARVPTDIGVPSSVVLGADGHLLELGAGGFGQASERVNHALVRRVLSHADDALNTHAKGGDALELFAGSGNFSVALASLKAFRLTTVEVGEEACVSARRNLALRGVSARVVQADALHYVWKGALRVLLLDPPRTGAREVAMRLTQQRVNRVIYVSCDPPTLGRDLGILIDAGYSLRSLELFEMFPQTSHVETLAVLDSNGVR